MPNLYLFHQAHKSVLKERPSDVVLSSNNDTSKTVFFFLWSLLTDDDQYDILRAIKDPFIRQNG